MLVDEWSSHEAELGGVEAGWAHITMIRPALTPDKRRESESSIDRM